MKDFDNTQAEKEGWLLASTDLNTGEHYQIQRLDPPEGESATNAKFKDDADALEFVQNKAAEGSVYHGLALRLEGRPVAVKFSIPEQSLECSECGDMVDALFLDPRDVPLETEPCLCEACETNATEDEIEELENRAASLKKKISKVFEEDNEPFWGRHDPGKDEFQVLVCLKIEDMKTFVEAARKKAKNQGIETEWKNIDDLLSIWFEPLEAEPVAVPPGALIEVVEVFI